MSGEEEQANFVTHDSFGKKPTIKLWFTVTWVNAGPEDPIVRNNNGGKSVISTPNVRDWDSFKRDLFGPSEDSIEDLVTYIDSDDDQIPIQSQCEFDEALRLATILATQKPRTRVVNLIVDRGFEARRGSEKANKTIGHTRNPDPPLNENYCAMPPMKLDDDVREFRKIQPSNETNYNTKESERSDDTPPKWFTKYIKTMKEDIVAEVSKRVMKMMMEALQKKRESQYDSGTSHPRASDREYFVDSDSEDDRSKVPLTDLSDDNKNSDSSLRSVGHRCENNARRRYRNADKQRRKHKSHVSQVPNNPETSSQRCYSSSPLNRPRGEKISKNRENENARASLTQLTSVNSGLTEEEIFAPKSPRNSENFGEALDTPYRRMIASGIQEMSFTPVNSTDSLDTPILKLRLTNSCHNGEQENVETKLMDDKMRMGCSVTGNDMLERANDRVPEYCALSDSDNISIISDISHNSEMQRISNSFEMILEQSINFTDETDKDRDFLVTTEFEENNRERVNEDLEVTRNSSSFELLSEPPSPPLSIHMDEDHFSPGRKETKNYNINIDDTTMEKRGNRNKLKTSPLIIDAQGKIYHRNIIDLDSADRAEIILEKRTDGSYTFVADTLPGLTRESMIKSVQSDSSTDETITVNDGSLSETERDATTKIPNDTNLDGKSAEGANSNDSFHESTQSFHSHTSPQTENERQDFAGYRSTSGHDETSSTTPRSHIFVDHNASKGLGDTRQSSPRKQESPNECHEDFPSESPRTSRRQSQNSNHSSTKRNGNSRQGEHTKKFHFYWTAQGIRLNDAISNAVDPMHILPEALVNGAVQVAASAFTRARRVYERILTAQTRKPADKSKFGRR